MKRRLPLLALLPLIACLPIPAAGQTASLVRDLTPKPGPYVSSSEPRGFLSAGNKVFFTARDPIHGDREPWVTDGTSEGTQLLGDLCLGDCYSEPFFLGTARGLLFFTSEDAGLWRSDGTRKGTFKLGGRPQGHYAFAGGALYFSSCDDQSRCGLWKSDGTVAGTVLLEELGYYSAEHLTAVGSRVYFVGDDADPDTYGRALWVSDGTESGTSVVRPLGDSYYSLALFTAVGNRLFFIMTDSDDSELWTSDGTAAGTAPVSAFEAPNPFGPTRWLKPVGDEVYFLADDVTHGVEIWRSDGTVQGTRRATDIGYHAPFDSYSSTPRQIAKIGDRLVFTATDGIHGRQLWTALGTPESTQPLAEGCPEGCPEPYNDALLEIGGRIVFAGYDEAHGTEPWTTDGTAGGTRRLADICSGSCNSVTEGAYALLGAAFFVARQEDSYEGKSALWRTDGTPQGTRRFAGPSPSVIQEAPAVLGKRLLFAALTLAYGVEPWIGDGTPGGTRMLADLAHTTTSSSPADLTPFGSGVVLTATENCPNVWRSSGAPGDLAPVTTIAENCYYGTQPRNLTVAGDLAYFWLDLDYNSPQVWASDGTPGGNRQVTQFQDGPYNDPPRLIPFQGKVYTLIERPYPEYEYRDLWRIDGSGSSKLFTAPESHIFQEIGAVGDRLYLTSYRQDGGSRLWVSNGGSSVTALRSGAETFFLPEARVGGWDYFVVFDSDEYESSLWRTDGTPDGTVPVLDGFGSGYDERPESLTAHQGLLYFFAWKQAESGETTWGLWRSDGTGAGTFLVKTFERSYYDDEAVPELISHGGHLYFAARDQDHGRELWRSDGTAAGTVLVRDILPGADGSGVSWLTVAGGRLFFAAFDPVHGTELWETDGTEAGTRLVHDIAPMAVSSRPAWLTAAGDRLFFTADDGVSGRELWSLPLGGGSEGCQASATTLCLSEGRFRVSVTWRDFQDNTGLGQAAPLTADTGTFWFFNPENVELVVKVLDGQGLNGHHWVFYGALSSVEYNLTVTDTRTGLTRHYFNPLHQLASVGDTRGFGPLGAFSRKKGTPPKVLVESAPVTAACQASATRLCLQGGRFAAEMTWTDFAGKTGKGQAVGLTGDTGYFWFFNAANVEVVVKVLDGRPVNDHFWAFYGALSNVEYTLKITDTATGVVKTYTNPSGNFASVADTGAF